MAHSFVFDQRPLRVYWETTRACDLACRHCRAEAVPRPDPAELTTTDGFRLLEQLAGFGEPLPHVVFTGGDPLKRQDLFQLIDAARGLGLRVSVAPSATPLLTEDAIRQLAKAGVDAISLSLDGSDAARHDAIRGIPGTYARTLAAADAAAQSHLPFQVNTLVCAETVSDLPAIYERVVAMHATRWSLFFLVTVGRGQVLEAISADRAEAVLRWATTLRHEEGGPIVTTTEAPHLRRVAIEQRRAAGHEAEGGGRGGWSSHGAGIRDGNGILFVSHTGDICPSGFLELSAGNVRQHHLVEVYQQAPLFAQLREPAAFSGRCGPCEYHWVCGGSRARAFATSGDPLGEDPLCPHTPLTLAQSNPLCVASAPHRVRE
jgi:radical SAM protein